MSKTTDFTTYEREYVKALKVVYSSHPTEANVTLQTATGHKVPSIAALRFYLKEKGVKRIKAAKGCLLVENGTILEIYTLGFLGWHLYTYRDNTSKDKKIILNAFEKVKNKIAETGLVY